MDDRPFGRAGTVHWVSILCAILAATGFAVAFVLGLSDGERDLKVWIWLGLVVFWVLAAWVMWTGRWNKSR